MFFSLPLNFCLSLRAWLSRCLNKARFHISSFDVLGAKHVLCRFHIRRFRRCVGRIPFHGAATVFNNQFPLKTEDTKWFIEECLVSCSDPPKTCVYALPGLNTCRFLFCKRFGPTFSSVQHQRAHHQNTKSTRQPNVSCFHCQSLFHASSLSLSCFYSGQLPDALEARPFLHWPASRCAQSKGPSGGVRGAVDVGGRCGSGCGEVKEAGGKRSYRSRG